MPSPFRRFLWLTEPLRQSGAVNIIHRTKFRHELQANADVHLNRWIVSKVVIHFWSCSIGSMSAPDRQTPDTETLVARKARCRLIRWWEGAVRLK